MKKFSMDYVNNYLSYTKDRKPDFSNILKIMDKKVPSRFTLFEFFLNTEFERRLAEYDAIPESTDERDIMKVKAFKNAGYDYCTFLASNYHFKTNANKHGKSSLSVNESAIIFDRKTYTSYEWNEPEDFEMSRLDKVCDALGDNMKILVYAPNGVLENVMSLVGYEGLCYMLSDDPELLEQIFDDVGSRLLRYYKLALSHSSVGGCFANDDWGFNTQTMLSVPHMEKYVFKWHKQIVDAIHEMGRPAILHSCGNLKAVYPHIIDTLGFNAKHSYEDGIQPVEEAYENLRGKIAVLGGIDLDFVCRKTPEEVYNRACAMLERTKTSGGYGLGSGNSIPEYVPFENYLAMISAATMNP